MAETTMVGGGGGVMNHLSICKIATYYTST